MKEKLTEKELLEEFKPIYVKINPSKASKCP